MVGPSGSGKSTLFNVAQAGTEYVVVENESTGDSSLRPFDATQTEKAKCGHQGRSETRTALIAELNDATFIVDLPGSNDTTAISGREFGEALQISIGLSLQSLTRCFTHLRMIGVVLLCPDIYGRAEKFQEALRNIGKIIKQKPELFDNVRFIINQTPTNRKVSQILAKIKAIGTANQDTFNDEMKFVVDCIEEKHLMLIQGIPGEDFRSEFLACSKQMTVKPFSAFDFTSYNKEAERFKNKFHYLLQNYEKTLTEECKDVKNELRILKSLREQTLLKLKEDAKQLGAQVIPIPNAGPSSLQLARNYCGFL